MFRSTARRSPKKNSAQRFYSMSSQIQEEHKAYYEILETTQKGGMDVTKWLVWFLDCLGRPIAKAKTLTAAVLEKDAFWRHLKKKSIEVSERQKTIINLLLDGIGGKLTTEKCGKLAKTSYDTAVRDIQDLIEKRILKQDKAGGRSTAYSCSSNAMRKLGLRSHFSRAIYVAKSVGRLARLWRFRPFGLKVACDPG